MATKILVRKARQGDLQSPALRNTAHHEAAHAVAAFHLRQPVRRATIVAKADSHGHVLHRSLKFGRHGEFDRTLSGVHRAESRIVVCYAGPIASRKLHPKSQWRVGGRGDFESASGYLAHLEDNDKKCNDLYKKLLWRRAELLVNRRWKDIQAVAAALLKHRTIDADGIRSAIDSAYGLESLVLSRTLGKD